MPRNKIKTINLNHKDGIFSSLINKLNGTKRLEISSLRHLLSNEKARLLHIVKSKNPTSIYNLAKMLDRNFKAVRYDVKILEKFGFIKLVASFKNGRERLQPVVDVDQVVITINL